MQRYQEKSSLIQSVQLLLYHIHLNLIVNWALKNESSKYFDLLLRSDSLLDYFLWIQNSYNIHSYMILTLCYFILTKECLIETIVTELTY
jgi:hypothetical protein